MHFQCEFDAAFAEDVQDRVESLGEPFPGEFCLTILLVRAVLAVPASGAVVLDVPNVDGSRLAGIAGLVDAQPCLGLQTDVITELAEYVRSL